MNIYSNKMAKERMPGVVKPLVWDINVLLFNSSWKRVLVELVGKYAQDLDIDNMSKAFYYRAYFNMGVMGDIFELLGMPRKSIELILGNEKGVERSGIRPTVKTLRFFHRIIIFSLDKLTFSRKIAKFLERQKEEIVRVKSRNIEGLDKKKTLEYIDELIEANREASYFNIVTVMIAGFYNKALEIFLDKINLDIDKINLQYNSERLRDIDPNYQLSILKEKYEGLSQAAKSKIHEKISIFPKSFQRTTFEKLFTAFLIKFGHFSDSNSDFSRLQWKERPDLILKLIIDFKETGSSQFDRRKNKVLIKNPAKRIPLSLICSYSTKYVEYSKRVSYVRSLGFAFLKDCFIYLGRLFKAEGLLENEQDIFFMTFSEIRSACKSKDIHREYRDNLERRKKEIAEYKDLKLPEIIYGEIPPIPSTTEKGARVRVKWVGVTTSKGYYEGPVKIVKGVQDFDKIQFGDVLVVPYAHISWTPLFAKAKALISESGGMLSHLSIWARESHIPAVVSVQGALELEDNTRVAVDGNKGEVIVLK